MHGIGKLFGPIRFPDEFGYWSHGARLLGYGWNEVSGIHPYYSFGYGMLMAPLLKWCSNPVVLYRIAVSINFILIVWCYVLLKKDFGNPVSCSCISLYGIVFRTGHSLFIFYGICTDDTARNPSCIAVPSAYSLSPDVFPKAKRLLYGSNGSNICWPVFRTHENPWNRNGSMAGAGLGSGNK